MAKSSSQQPRALRSPALPHPPALCTAHVLWQAAQEQLAASPAICCCSLSGEEQVNALAAFQSPHPLCVCFSLRGSYSHARPSVPQSPALWGRNDRTQFLQWSGLSGVHWPSSVNHICAPAPISSWTRRGATALPLVCVEGLFVFISLCFVCLCQPT